MSSDKLLEKGVRMIGLPSSRVHLITGGGLAMALHDNVAFSCSFTETNVSLPMLVSANRGCTEKSMGIL